MIGPHVFGDGRLGVWFIYSADFNGKLRDRLPRLSPLRITDIFLPREATLADKALVQEARLFVALYETPPAGKSAAEYAAQAIADVNRLKVGALELNIEGLLDADLAPFVRETVRLIRLVKPALRLRINVVPFKGKYLPGTLIYTDPQLYVISQSFLGNMDARCAENEIARDLVDWGIPREKVSVMYAAHCSPGVGRPRVPSLPEIRWRGSIFSDDLLADGGYLS